MHNTGLHDANSFNLFIPSSQNKLIDYFLNDWWKVLLNSKASPLLNIFHYDFFPRKCASINLGKTNFHYFTSCVLSQTMSSSNFSICSRFLAKTYKFLKKCSCARNIYYVNYSILVSNTHSAFALRLRHPETGANLQ